MCCKLTAILCCLLLICFQANSQKESSSSVIDVDVKVLDGLSKQYDNLQSKLHKQSSDMLSKMQKKESMLQAKLSSIDSSKVKEVFNADVTQQYSDLSSKLAAQKNKFKKFPLTEYVSGIDSVQTTLNFLIKSNTLSTSKMEEIKSLNDKLKGLQDEIQKANTVQQFVRERATVLKEKLINTGLAKQLKKINKQVFYYQQQLAEYKALLNDKQKLKEKLLNTIRELPAFQKFWEKNSYVAALFSMPNDYTLENLSGIQTRSSVQAMLNQRMGLPINTQSLGGGSTIFQQQMDIAQTQLSQLKEKINKFSSGADNSEMTMPDFKPDEEKTKTFSQRIEYGFNIQSEHGQYGLPTTSDLALTIGYRLADDKRLGIGASYKIGWGNGIKNIHFSSEGIGLRSYFDVKSPFKSQGIFFKGLWLSGGFEYNYLNSFRNLQELHTNIDVWQKSALVGLSKKYKVGKKEGNLQLLYDFLHNQQTPSSKALKFRLGYTF